MKPVTVSDDVVAVVLAGGYGRRIRHVLHDRPKPMAQVAGRPFVEWVVRWLRRNGVRQVVLSTGYRSDLIEAHFAASAIGDSRVGCVAEPFPMGTAGGFLNAVNGSGLSPSVWVVANGDSIVAAFEPVDPKGAELRREIGFGRFSEPEPGGIIHAGYRRP